MIGNRFHLGHMVWGRGEWPPRKNFNAITRGQRCKLWEEGKKKKKMSTTIVSLFQGAEIHASSRITMILMLGDEEWSDCCHLTGPPEELNYPLNIYTTLAVSCILSHRAFVTPPALEGVMLLSVSSLSTGTEFMIKARPQDRRVNVLDSFSGVRPQSS